MSQIAQILQGGIMNLDSDVALGACAVDPVDDGAIGTQAMEVAVAIPADQMAEGTISVPLKLVVGDGENQQEVSLSGFEASNPEAMMMEDAVEQDVCDADVCVPAKPLNTVEEPEWAQEGEVPAQVQQEEAEVPEEIEAPTNEFQEAQVQIPADGSIDASVGEAAIVVPRESVEEAVVPVHEQEDVPAMTQASVTEAQVDDMEEMEQLIELRNSIHQVVHASKNKDLRRLFDLWMDKRERISFARLEKEVCKQIPDDQKDRAPEIIDTLRCFKPLYAATHEFPSPQQLESATQQLNAFEQSRSRRMTIRLARETMRQSKYFKLTRGFVTRKLDRLLSDPRIEGKDLVARENADEAEEFYRYFVTPEMYRKSVMSAQDQLSKIRECDTDKANSKALVHTLRASEEWERDNGPFSPNAAALQYMI